MGVQYRRILRDAAALLSDDEEKRVWRPTIGFKHVTDLDIGQIKLSEIHKVNFLNLRIKIVKIICTEVLDRTVK